VGCGGTYSVPEYARSRPPQSFTHTCRSSKRASEGGSQESLFRVRSDRRVIDYCVRVDGQAVAVDPKNEVLEALAKGKEVEHGFIVPSGEHYVEIYVAYADGATGWRSQTYAASGKTCTWVDLAGGAVEDCPH
jgi:hypothetical protein